MSPSLLHGGYNTSGLHRIFSTSITPFDVVRISFLEDGEGISIDDKLSVLSIDCAFELAMSRIILEHVDHVIEVNEGIIDGDNIHYDRIKSSPGDQAPKTIKSVHIPSLSCLRVEAVTGQGEMAVCQTGGAQSLYLVLTHVWHVLGFGLYPNTHEVPFKDLCKVPFHEVDDESEEGIPCLSQS